MPEFPLVLSRVATWIAAGILAATLGKAAPNGNGSRPHLENSPEFLSSPDGRVRLAFMIGEEGQPHYRVDYRKRVVLEPGRLGFLVKDGPLFDRRFRVVSLDRTNRDERWQPVWGERAEIRDHYHGLKVRLEDDQAREMQIEFRAYDEGVALRYLFSSNNPTLTATDELTEFRFSGDHPCWAVYSAQGIYERRRISEVKPGCERPLTVELADSRWAAIGEAALVDFARMKFQPAGNSNSVRAHLAGPSTIPPSGVTPWRFVLLADSPGQLIERNFLVLNLNEPCAMRDTSWIRPGTVIREVTLTTDGGKACVDFAARMGIGYVEFDAGWYGHEYSDESDARAVNVDPKRSKGPLDLQEVIRYATQRGVGVMLYVNRRALERQLDTILPLYEQWGVKGVKYGFVNVGSQHWTTWLHEAVRKAAEHHLVVDVHDEYRPTGVSRTWPNLLTQEGVRGNEEMPSAAHNLILPFARFLSGPADYTFCWSDRRLKNTQSHQLAASIVFFSPLQFLFWYDRPGQIGEEPALEFWKELPTTWDETRVLEGTPGEFVSIARRKGSTWYVGSMNGLNLRTINLRTGFLDPGKEYDALVCSDPDTEEGRPAQVTRQTVRCGDRLRAQALPNGGLAVRFTPKDGRVP